MNESDKREKALGLIDAGRSVQAAVYSLLTRSNDFPLHFSLQRDVDDLWEWRDVAGNLASAIVNASRDLGLELCPPTGRSDIAVDSVVLSGVRCEVVERYGLIGYRSIPSGHYFVIATAGAVPPEREGAK